MYTMRRASTCFAKAHRSCCSRREHCHRDWPDPRGTSSVVLTACRYKHTVQSIVQCTNIGAIVLSHRCRQLTNKCHAHIHGFPLLPDDPELDRSQAGGRPVREGQCQRHRQSPQHLSALCCLCGDEELCGGERNWVAGRSRWRMSFIFCKADLSVLHVIGPDKDFIASKMCLTVLCQSLQSGASALCFITVSSKKHFRLCFFESFTAYELGRKPTFCNESKLSSTPIGSLGKKNPDIIL